jgi:endonuclease-3 related protein
MAVRIVKSPDAALALREVYGLLRGHFGYADVWWPGSPAEVLVTAMLVQQSDWSAAWRGAMQLADAGWLSLSKLAGAEPETVRACIRNVNLAPTKARRLVGLARSLRQRGFDTFEDYLTSTGDAAALRSDLLTFPGIGPETADCILSYACNTHAVVVVDALARRIFQRLRIAPQGDEQFWEKSSYNDAQGFFHEHVLPQTTLYADLAFADSVRREVALARDMHAQIVELARHHCTAHNPRCHDAGGAGWRDYEFCNMHCEHNCCRRCPLSEICPTATAHLPR